MKTIKKLITGLLTIGILLNTVTPTHAMILFTNDVFENDSNTFQIGSNDDAAIDTITLEFGGTNSEAITWDTTKFDISDDIDVEGITSTGVIDFSGVSRMSLHQDSSNPGTCTEGDIFYNTADHKIYVCTAADVWTAAGNEGDASTLDTLDSLQFIRADATDTYGDGGAYNLSFGTDDVLQLDGTLDANGIITLGDNADTITIDSSVWDVSSAGIISGLTGFTSTGIIDFSGASQLALRQGTSNPVTCTEGDIFYNTISNKAYLCTDINTWTDLEDTNADTLDTLNSTQFLRNDVSDTFGIGGTHTLAIGSDDILEINGTLNAHGVVTIGDNGDTVAIDSSTWDISAAGVASGFTGITSSGTVDFNSATSFRLHESTNDPATCTEGQIYYNTADNKIRFCVEVNTWEDISPDVVSERTDGGAIECGTADTTILTHTSSIDGSDVINIQVNIHLKNTGGTNATIAIGDLKLKRNTAEVYSNNQEIEVGTSFKGENPGYAFSYRDIAPGDSPVYTVTCAASSANEISGDADLFLDNGSGGGGGEGGSGEDFETVYSSDGDDSLTTANATFTINTGTSDFIVDSNDWTVDTNGNLTLNSITAAGVADFSGVSRMALDQDTSNPAACTEGDIFYNTTENEAYVCIATNVWGAVGGTDANTLDTLDSLQLLRADATDTYGDGGTYTLTVGGDDTLDVDGTLRADGILDANGAITLGDNGDSVIIDSSTWDISSAGVVSGLTGITSAGTIDFSGASRMALRQETSNPGTCTEGDIIYNSTDNNTYVCTATNIWTRVGGTDANTLDTLDSLQLLRADATDTYGDGGAYTLTVGSDDTLDVDGTLQADGALDANGVITLGDNEDNITIDSSTWDITSAGVASGLTGITSNGTINFSGSSSFRIQEGTSDPVTCTEGQLYYNVATNKLKVCISANTWEDVSPTVITEREDGAAITCGTSDTVILTHNSAIDGASVLNIQINTHLTNSGSTTSSIAAGNLKLKRGASTIYSNDQVIEVGGAQKGHNPSYGFSYRDTSPGDSPVYTVTCAADDVTTIDGDADLLLDNGAGGGAAGAGGGGDDFETVYATDADNSLVTGNSAFTINTGSSDFIITSNNWSVDASGNLSTSGAADFSGASRLALDQGGSNPGTCTEGDIFYNTTDNTVYACTATDTWGEVGSGSNADTLDTLDSLKFLRADATDNFGDGGSYTLAIGGDDTLRIGGTLDANGQITLGDGGDTVVIDSSDWDINATGDMAGVGAISMNGNFTQIGTTNLSTGAGTVLLNGATTVADGKSFTANGTVTIGDGGDAVSVNSTSWDISTSGLITGLTGITSTGNIDFRNTTSFRTHQGTSNPVACNEGQLFYNTNNNNTYTCTTTGNPGTWTAISNFEGIYTQDIDNTLNTSDSDFTINTGTGDFLVTSNDWGVDANGNLGIGLNNPAFNLHLYDTGSTATTEWQVFDDGTNQVSILTGTQDPTSVATNADIGSIFLNTTTGQLYTKQDDGSSTSWEQGGLNSDLNDALTGTFGTPSSVNKFVTDTDPRLQATSGTFGETALGSRLDYSDFNLTIDSGEIFYARIFLPENTTVNSMGVYTVQVKTTDINLGIYSDSNGPNTLLGQTGTQSAVSTADFGFNSFSLTSPLNISTAGYYWAALALGSVMPKGATLGSADDRFMPYRTQSKAAGSTTLPSTSTPAAVGGVNNLPYFAAFE